MEYASAKTIVVVRLVSVVQLVTFVCIQFLYNSISFFYFSKNPLAYVLIMIRSVPILFY
jgi:hypothetical protein